MANDISTPNEDFTCWLNEQKEDFGEMSHWQADMIRRAYMAGRKDGIRQVCLQLCYHETGTDNPIDFPKGKQ